jgi:hypothetical protein
MGQVGFGQPDDGVIQMAYVVRDVRAAMKRLGREGQSRSLVPARALHRQ